MKVWLLFLLMGSLVPGAACASHTDCSCAGPGNLYYDLDEKVPSGGSVEVCFGEVCVIDSEPFRDDGRASGSVREEALGEWTASPAKALVVTVRSADGTSIHQETVVATEEQGECCGPYRELRT